ncbi:ThiF family adenylyltransferase [Sphingosinicella sp. YJ22]|uniref:HesA/MoeB/ThiF family protein n=1 Tax=Sphingosinicella sp. YJ22 TaxID=1104780 RepID=UPI001FB03BE1|nr:ThiF family adenylyltransferase [Sphingosinicella sp. YJ22]
MLIESAHRLLAGEAPTPGTAAEVASAHRTTIGQSVRKQTLRFIVSSAAKSGLMALPQYQVLDVEVVEHFVAGYWLAFPRRVMDGDAVRWDASLELPTYRVRKGLFVRIDASFLSKIKPDYGLLRTIAELSQREDLVARVDKSDAEMPFVIECGGTFRLLSIPAGSGTRTVFDYRTVAVPPSSGARLPPEYARLSAASVAIVGCGSVGSKVAASLARSGVGRFVLVDGDLMLADNVVRNDLDWRSVGLSKPDAVEDRIGQIRPSAAVEKRRLDLGGQESSDATDAALVAIGGCDVIVDATADPQVFNLCGAVAKSERRTLVWGEVFAGGIGGLVARLRPGVEPVPHAARRQILAWCAEHGVLPPAGTAEQYGLSLPGGVPLIVADDADVTVMAAHVSRLVVDALTRDESLFPQAAYAVGLKPGWIFGAPFETWPIDLKPEGEWGPPTDENIADELNAMVREFFPAAPEGGSS